MSTTSAPPPELAVKVVGRRTGRPTAGHSIALMVRNRFEPPPCHVCGKPAERICLDCHYDVASVSQGYVCETDVAAHQAHAYSGMGMLGIYNSPRTGTCAYDGPAEPPW